MYRGADDLRVSRRSEKLKSVVVYTLRGARWKKRGRTG